MANYAEIKQDMTLCDGARKGGFAFPCRGQLYKCTQCGNQGCRQHKLDACTGQAFDVAFRCLKCGALGQQEAVTSS